MQYETIILELLSRIKKLEEDVEALKQSNSVNNEKKPNTSSVTYTKMTNQMIEACYKYGKQVFDGANAQELAKTAAEETGMNQNSASMYMYVVNCLLSGEVYKRSISKNALEMYFGKISVDYGSKGLKKAINSARQHIDFRRSQGQTVDSIEEVCNKFAKKI